MRLECKNKTKRRSGSLGQRPQQNQVTTKRTRIFLSGIHDGSWGMESDPEQSSRADVTQWALRMATLLLLTDAGKHAPGFKLGGAHSPGKRCRNTHKHSGPILEGTGHACVVGEAGIAVARWQSRIQKGLLCCVVGLRLALLCLSWCCWRSRGCRVSSAKLGDVT